MRKSKHQDHLKWAHPLVRTWFLAKFGAPTEPQIAGWPAILAGETTLISAPTGSGKTLAAFLTCIDQLIRLGLSGKLTRKTRILYVSPLKALTNDVQKNLLAPLAEMAALAKEQGLTFPEIDVAVRTGDTLSRERQAMLKTPPHVLVTTPESLYILLTAEKSRAMLASVQTVIVDEIHALANDKRGAHLLLSLERLEALCPQKIVRIGLSATQKPIELVGDFLTGNGRCAPTIINIGHMRQWDLSTWIPDDELGAVASNALWEQIYDQLARFAEQHRSTLIFTNTRRLAERIAHHLSERLGEDQVAAHHGSLSRKLRLAAETKLKQGELKALVATASLELGIDIGHIDLVCQIGSPRSIAALLQRVGRAGHWHEAVSKGVLIATTRDELLECAALARAVQSGDLDRLLIPHEPLDILSQQIVAACASQDWREEDLYQLVKRAYHYANLTRETFDALIEMLSNGIAASRGRYGAYLFRDQVGGLVKARRHSRLTAITSGGAIPDNGLFTVVTENGTVVGTLDEDFAVESNRGDIILLGSTSWQIIRIDSAAGRVHVVDANGAPPSVPFWRGEAPGRTPELSQHVSQLRQQISDLLPLNCGTICDNLALPAVADAINWLIKACCLPQKAAEQLLEYIRKGRALLGAVPTQDTIIAERFFDEGGGMQLIIHAPFGARINKAWGLALRKRFCRSFNFELQASATDDGLNIALAEQHSFPLADVFQYLHPNSVKEVLVQAVLQSPLFQTRFRWDATRALALVRFRNGKKMPPNLLRMLADDLLAAVFPDAAACQDNLGGRDIELPHHPLIDETMKDALHEALDVDGLTNLLQRVIAGDIQCLAVDTPLPSVFSHEILNANPYAFLDDAPLEERRARAVSMRQVLPESILQEVGKLDPIAIAAVKQTAWPDVRSADELSDALQTFIALPIAWHEDNWQPYFNELIRAKRAGIATCHEKKYWVAAEKAKTFQAIYPDATLPDYFIEIEKTMPQQEDAILTLLRGVLSHVATIAEDELSAAFDLTKEAVHQALVKLESTGFILRGTFRSEKQGQLEWCERRLLARIHRLTLSKLRENIAPVSAVQFVNWLAKWQHVAQGTQAEGEAGLLSVIRKLQGFEIPANAWEKDIFAKRVKYYSADMLDRLCLSGLVGWGRLSTHPAFESDEKSYKKRIMPTSVAPITFFIREEADWMAAHPEMPLPDALSHAARAIYAYLEQKGASFFADIVRGVGMLKTEVETGLWELVTTGQITSDGFDNLRALIEPKRRAVKKRRYGYAMQRFSSGRWSLLHREMHADHAVQLESVCFMLLNRYGVVFRDLLAREKNIPRWYDILLTLRRLEERGEIRGGLFVQGFVGEQFALPTVVSSLRAMREQSHQDAQVHISAVDPLNLIGIILSGEKVPAISGRSLVLPE